MYIAQVFKYKHDWWRYLIGVILAFVFSQIGTIPLIIAAGMKVVSDGGSIMDLEDPNILMSVLESNLSLFLMLLSFAIGLIGIVIAVKYVHNQPFKTLTTSRKKVDWSRIWFGFGLIVFITILLTGIDFYTNPVDYEVQFQLKPFLLLLIIVVIFIPLQTSFEEYLFRGYLMQGIGILAQNKWLPLLITSVVFGGLHFFNPEVEKMGNIVMVYYIGTGLFLGIITLMDEGMELALGFHAGTNLIISLLVTSDWTVFQTHSILKDLSEPSAGIEAIMPVFVVYPILLFIMAKKYKWTDWKGKLFGKVTPPPQPISIENDTIE